jgi:type IV secretory pathway TrbL component
MFRAIGQPSRMPYPAAVAANGSAESEPIGEMGTRRSGCRCAGDATSAINQSANEVGSQTERTAKGMTACQRQSEYDGA